MREEWFGLPGDLFGRPKQRFCLDMRERVAIFSCFATFLGELRYKNNSFWLVWEIALHWEWKIFLRMQRFWTLETICVAWSKLPARWCAKKSSNLSRYTTQAMQPRRQSLLGHGLSPYKKAKKQIFLRERAPDEICFYLFCMACSFREKKCLHYGKRYGRLIFAVTW